MRVIDVSGDAPAVTYNEADSSSSAGASSTWLQAGAYGQLDGAEQLAGKLKRASLSPVSIHEAGDLFRVWLGPYSSAAEVESVISRAIELGFERPHRVKR
ncbi:MAG: SPOR domain-containing protein [Xanthomonadales bacterium]|nr:SPOR domain-containing protein [Xanthomonadales bacterium]